MTAKSPVWSRLPTVVAQLAALKQSPIPTFWVDENGAVGYVNLAFQDLLGYDENDLIGRTLDCFLPAIGVDQWREGWWSVLENNKAIHNFPSSWLHKSGIRLERDVSVSRVDAAGLVFAAFHLWPKPAPKEVFVKNQATALLDELTEGVCILDMTNSIRYINHAMCRMIGCGEIDLVGQSFVATVVPDKLKMSEFWMVLEDKRGKVEFKFKNLGGRNIVVRMSVVAVSDETGEINHKLVSFVDLTAQTEVAGELEARTASLERLAANIPGFIYTFRMTPKGQFSFPYASRGCSEMFGVDPDSAKDDATPILQTIHPDDIGLFQSSVLESAQTLRPWNCEARLVTVDDEWKWFHGASRPELKENGDIVWEGLVMDVTDRKCAEAELAVAKEAAEDSAQSRPEFLANMSHEIRTPLNAIIGFSHLTLKTKLDAAQSDYLRKIRSSSELLLGIINNILDFSKIESGNLSIERIPFSLDAVIEKIGDVLESKAAEKGLELLIDMETGVPSEVIGDPLRLEQILINLCNNAVKFTEHGFVRVSVKRKALDGHEVVLEFSVKDTGIGLSEAQQEKIFDSFTQADTSITRKHGGTGLGLSISKRLVELIGGELRVQSSPGRGSEFSFQVCLGVDTATAHSQPSLPEKFGDLRVLMVGTSDESGSIVENLLQINGFAVTRLSSLEEAMVALDRCAANENDDYGLFIFDWNMADTGAENVIAGLRRIRAQDDNRQIPRIILASSLGIDPIKSMLEEGVLTAFISKPVLRTRLIESIASAFELDRTGGEKTDLCNSGNKVDYRQQLQGSRILLVEDNEINQEVACKILQDMGVQVTVAADGGKAVEKLLAVEGVIYDAVLMDLQMPEMDGLEATRQIRTHKRLRDVPIIAMTAHALESERNKCLAAGMQDHVPKPFDPDHLAMTLSGHIELKKAKPSELDLSPFGVTNPESCDDVLCGSLERLACVKTAKALTMLNGDAALLFRLLKNFVAENQDVEKVLGDCIDQSDIERAAQVVHRLKGVAGNLQIDFVFQASVELEEALQKGCTKRIRDLIRRLATEIERLALELKPSEAAGHSKDTHENRRGEIATLGMEDVLKGLQQLILYLENNNFQATQCFVDLHPRLAATDGAATNHLRDTINALDFNTAAATARRLHKRLLES